jgi:hypothetical protein
MARASSLRKSLYVAVFRSGNESTWCWEIRRKRRPMGVRLRDEGYRSYSAAQSAGRTVLEDFLNGLAMDPGLGGRI